MRNVCHLTRIRTDEWTQPTHLFRLCSASWAKRSHPTVFGYFQFEIKDNPPNLRKHGATTTGSFEMIWSSFTWVREKFIRIVYWTDEVILIVPSTAVGHQRGKNAPKIPSNSSRSLMAWWVFIYHMVFTVKTFLWFVRTRRVCTFSVVFS